jgi:hypothetical protein
MHLDLAARLHAMQGSERHARRHHQLAHIEAGQTCRGVMGDLPPPPRLAHGELLLARG